jgi:hypothetical protein
MQTTQLRHFKYTDNDITIKKSPNYPKNYTPVLFTKQFYACRATFFLRR